MLFSLTKDRFQSYKHQSSNKHREAPRLGKTGVVKFELICDPPLTVESQLEQQINKKIKDQGAGGDVY